MTNEGEIKVFVQRVDYHDNCQEDVLTTFCKGSGNHYVTKELSHKRNYSTLKHFSIKPQRKSEVFQNSY